MDGTVMDYGAKVSVLGIFNFRTLQGQLELWALVGRAALDNPDLPASFIAESIMSMAESRDGASDFVLRTRKKK